MGRKKYTVRFCYRGRTPSLRLENPRGDSFFATFFLITQKESCIAFAPFMLIKAPHRTGMFDIFEDF